MSMFLGLQTCADVGGFRVHVRRLNIFWKFICNGVEKRTTKRSKKSYFRLFFGYKCCLSLVPGLFIFQKISWMKRSKFRWCSNNLNLVIGFFLVYLRIPITWQFGGVHHLPIYIAHFKGPSQLTCSCSCHLGHVRQPWVSGINVFGILCYMYM